MNTLLLISLFSYLLLGYCKGSSVGIRINNEDLEDSSPHSKAKESLQDYICVSCELGSYSGENCSKDCPDRGLCPSNLTSSSCIPCSPGTFSDSYNSTACSPCHPGTVSSFKGTINCAVCLAGTSNDSSSTQCVPCAPGSEAPANGTSECALCPPGSFSTGGSLQCQECPPGTFNEARGSGECSSCGKGKFNPEPGSASPSACLTCPSGYYCADDNTSKPIDCPENTYCESGAITPIPCSMLFQSDVASSNCHAQIYLYVIVAAGAAVTVIVIVFIIWFKTRQGTSSEQVVATDKSARYKSETASLIPPPEEGPVYNGL